MQFQDDKMHEAFKYLNIQISRCYEKGLTKEREILENLKELLYGNKVLKEQSSINGRGEQVTQFLVVNRDPSEPIPRD